MVREALAEAGVVQPQVRLVTAGPVLVEAPLPGKHLTLMRLPER